MAAEALAVENARKLAPTAAATRAFAIGSMLILRSFISPSSFGTLLFALPRN
jgi:hypothetical protein